MTLFGNLKRKDVFKCFDRTWICLGNGFAMCQNGTIRKFDKKTAVEVL